MQSDALGQAKCVLTKHTHADVLSQTDCADPSRGCAHFAPLSASDKRVGERMCRQRDRGEGGGGARSVYASGLVAQEPTSPFSSWKMGMHSDSVGQDSFTETFDLNHNNNLGAVSKVCVEVWP